MTPIPSQTVDPFHIVTPASGDTDLPVFLARNRQAIERALLTPRAVLFRGFDVPDAAHFQRVAEAISPNLLTYEYRSTTRAERGQRIYTATEYPGTQSITLHCENAYQSDWPMKVIFYAERVADQGGETPVADMLRVLQRIPADIVAAFARRKLMYVRNYPSRLSTGLDANVDIPWQAVFQTEERADVEHYCRTHRIEWHWKEDGGLRTRQICQGTARHPTTQRVVWFNQAHVFHTSNLDPRTESRLRQLYREEDLPRNVLYGDGEPIDPSVLNAVRAAFAAEEAKVPWQQGDVMLLDNMLMAHGRRPFTGPRSVLVALADPYSQCIEKRPALRAREPRSLGPEQPGNP